MNRLRSALPLEAERGSPDRGCPLPDCEHPAPHAVVLCPVNGCPGPLRVNAMVDDAGMTEAGGRYSESGRKAVCGECGLLVDVTIRAEV